MTASLHGARGFWAGWNLVGYSPPNPASWHETFEAARDEVVAYLDDSVAGVAEQALDILSMRGPFTLIIPEKDQSVWVQPAEECGCEECTGDRWPAS